MVDRFRRHQDVHPLSEAGKGLVRGRHARPHADGDKQEKDREEHKRLAIGRIEEIILPQASDHPWWTMIGGDYAAFDTESVMSQFMHDGNNKDLEETCFQCVTLDRSEKQALSTISKEVTEDILEWHSHIASYLRTRHIVGMRIKRKGDNDRRRRQASGDSSSDEDDSDDKSDSGSAESPTADTPAQLHSNGDAEVSSAMYAPSEAGECSPLSTVTGGRVRLPAIPVQPTSRRPPQAKAAPSRKSIASKGQGKPPTVTPKALSARPAAKDGESND